MPRIVPYPDVLAALATQGLTPAYPNGGAFHVEGGHVLGLIGGDDTSIRPGLRTIPVDRSTLPQRLVAGWQQLATPRCWLTPAHHWAHELDHGGVGATVLDALHLDAASLRGVTNAPAVEVTTADDLRTAAACLFHDSDWFATFPDLPPERATTAMLHHHGHLWWTTRDAASAKWEV